MNQLQYTKAPWRASAVGASVFSIAVKDKFKHDTQICAVLASPQRLANARLMAAAPDLRIGCELAARFLDLDSGQNWEEKRALAEFLPHVLSASLAKAESGVPIKTPQEVAEVANEREWRLLKADELRNADVRHELRGAMLLEELDFAAYRVTLWAALEVIQGLQDVIRSGANSQSE